MKLVCIALNVALVLSGSALIGQPNLIAAAEPASLAAAEPTADGSKSAEPRVGTQAISAALKEKTSVDFVETPLSDVISSIADKHHLDIQFDFAALKDASPPIDPTTTPITRSAKDISLRSAFELMLADYQLTCLIKDDELVITTREAAERMLEPRVYDVHDLVTTDDDGVTDFKSLTDLLRGTVATSSWDDAGGNGQTSIFGTTLVVSQTAEVQEQITALFSALRQVQEQIKIGDTSAAVPFGLSDADKSIRRKLSEKVDRIDFTETPLSDVVSFLADKYKLQIQFDFAALKDATPPIDPTTTPITRAASGISLHSASKLILEDHGLTTILCDEVLLITTKERADKTMVTLVYPVDDLFDRGGNAKDASVEVAETDFDSLINAITSTVAAESWGKTGGLGTVVPFEKNGRALAVSQTQEAHDGIADLLAMLRDAHRQQQDAVAKALKAEPEKIVLRVYKLRTSEPGDPAPQPPEVVEVVKSLVEPKGWGQGEAYIRGITGELVVRQTPSVHREIEKVLTTLNARRSLSGSQGGQGNKADKSKSSQPQGGLGGGGFGGGGGGGF